MTAAQGHFGQRGQSDSTDGVNAMDFQIRQALGKVRTAVPVKIIAVHGGGVGKPPTVDVQPLVNQIDGLGQKEDHGIIYGIAVSRNQGGGSAIINDPVVDDIGVIMVADRDISALKANDGAQSNPGSYRTHDLADGIYSSAMLNPANPDQYVMMDAQGVTIVDKNGNSVTMSSSGIEVSSGGDVTVGCGGILKLGDGPYAFVETVSGPSSKVMASL